MKAILRIMAVMALPFATPVHAIVGGAAPAAEDIARSVVTIVGSRGNSCSGTLIAPDLVLSVAHCVGPGAIYKIVEYGRDRQPRLRDVRRVAAHPGFDIKTMLAHRATADVSLLQLETPKGQSIRDRCPRRRLPPVIISPSPALALPFVATARAPAWCDPPIWSRPAIPATCRSAWSIPWRAARARGLAPAPGDSGGPVFEDQQGKRVVVGIVDWSTGPNASDGCGGLTGVTPLTLYRDWIVQTAQHWGSTLAAP